MLALFPRDELERDASLEASVGRNGFRGITLAVNVDRKEDVDAVIDHVRSIGGMIIREPSEASWGGRTAYFSDPEENVWEVAWNPHSTFDERGAMLSL